MERHAHCPLILLLALLAGCGGGDGDGLTPAPGEVAVHVERVAVDDNHLPVVILGERDGSRWLPIWIGSAEARSIASAEQAAPRPNTHDLARSVIQGLDAEVVRVVVTELRTSTYYATLTLRTRSGLVEIDSRPSDAIAIALRSGAPIYVREELFDSNGGETTPSHADGGAHLEI